MKTICIGHASFDTTMPINEYPIENYKYRIGDCIECGGGPASNAAYLLAKWGMDSTFVGVVGNDYYGSRIINEFKEIGVHTSYIETTEQDNTSSSYILANKSNGSRTIITDKIIPIRKLQKNISGHYDVIVVDGEHPETAKEVLENNKEAIRILDGGHVTEDTKMLGKLCTHVACSKEFAEKFTNKKMDIHNKQSMIDIYEELKSYFNNTIIITLEEHGAFTKTEDYELIPSISVKALDSTGAGDIFHGSLAYFLGNQYSLKEAIRLANITGALSVTKIGSRNSIPDLNTVIKTGEESERI